MNKAVCVLGAVLLYPLLAGAGEKWAVHEWGTFTALQDETGRAIGGINTDDEPVPPFVHQLDERLLLRPSDVPPKFNKGAPACHPDVTMRLETPVIYFHPPASEPGIQPVSVVVKFRGGWLTEFYPDAVAEAPGIVNRTNGFPHLLSTTTSSLAWNGLQAGGDWPLTNTSAHVWTSPRAVRAASVLATNGESEKFLFYRGIAHIDAPLRITRDAKAGELRFHGQLEDLPAGKPLEIHSLWLVDIHPGGKVAFRPLPPLSVDDNPDTVLPSTPASFAPGDYSPDNLEKLKASLLAALVAEGLYDDEARALLNTWEVSYFKSPGLRVFFTVPREWTDYHLPLEISRPADIRRVMVGRIELVTPEQRLDLQKIASLSPEEIRLGAGLLFTNYMGKLESAVLKGNNQVEINRLVQEMEQLSAGQKPLASIGSIPTSYKRYLDLGRFRNALVLEASKHQPTEGLTNFILTYGLQGYQPVETPLNPEKARLALVQRPGGK